MTSAWNQSTAHSNHQSAGRLKPPLAPVRMKDAGLETQREREKVWHTMLGVTCPVAMEVACVRVLVRACVRSKSKHHCQAWLQAHQGDIQLCERTRFLLFFFFFFPSGLHAHTRVMVCEVEVCLCRVLPRCFGGENHRASSSAAGIGTASRTRAHVRARESGLSPLAHLTSHSPHSLFRG